jgi:metallo-beta-lactamase family protein
MKIRFLGALGTVTGSCTLLNHRDRYYLVDCGMVQGGGTGGSTFAFNPSGIRGVFLTHAHLDHCGLLPLLAKEGFRGKIYCTRATADLTRHALMDLAALGECAFSAADVERLEFACPDEHEEFEFGRFFPVDRDLSCAFIRTSHILGAVGFEFQFSDWNASSAHIRKTIVFSGDIGCNTDQNPYQALLNGRQYPSTHAEYVICESTYGDRERESRHMNFRSRLEALKRLLGEASALGCGAAIVFPCFTLQRVQEMVVDLHCLLDIHLTGGERREWLAQRTAADGNLANILVDSPLAAKYGVIFARELQRVRGNGKPFYLNPELSGRLMVAEEAVDSTLQGLLCPRSGITQGRNYSLTYFKELADPGDALRVIIAGAGMCNGGRVTGHLKELLPSPKTVVALTGYQAAGTPGGEIMRRAEDPTSEIDAAFWDLSNGEIRARIVNLSPYYSGHADRNGLLDFVMRKNSQHYYEKLKRIFLVHGDNQSRSSLRRAVIGRANETRQGDRPIASVELPDPMSGWFDLLKNDWVHEFHAKVDRLDVHLSALQAEVRRLSEAVASFGVAPCDVGAAKQLRAELSVTRDDLRALACGD